MLTVERKGRAQTVAGQTLPTYEAFTDGELLVIERTLA